MFLNSGKRFEAGGAFPERDSFLGQDTTNPSSILPLAKGEEDLLVSCGFFFKIEETIRSWRGGL